MNQPLVSVIVPCYNQAQYMDECLQSVLDQTYQNWECIMVNDGSPDHTEEVALEWTQKDSRFIYLKKENGGLSSARNAGIEIAKGEWILPLDCDDKIGSQYLELAAVQFDKDYTIIYCEAEFFGDKEGKWELRPFDFKNLLLQNMIFCTFFYKKEYFNLINGYDEDLKEAYEDWDFLIRLIHYNNIHNVCKLPETLFFYRIKDSSMLSNISNKYKKIRNQIYNKNKKIYDLYFNEDYSYLIFYNNSLEIEIEYYKKKLVNIYSNPLFKIYFFLQKIFYDE
ncbi:glycosyltransferase family 2 protein [Empedobacter falsenii]